MKIPSNDVLVRAFKRGWANAADCFSSRSAAEFHKDALITGGIVSVIRAIESYKIPPATVDGFQMVEIEAKDKFGRTVIVNASVFDGKLSGFKPEETQPAPPEKYEYTELKYKDGNFLRDGNLVVGPAAIDKKFQDILGLNASPENLYGPAAAARYGLCTCNIEMATFRVAGSQCPHCGQTVQHTAKVL